MTSSRLEPGPGIAPETLIPELLKCYPQLRTVFDRYGLKGCGGLHGPHETVRFFSRAHAVEETTILQELREALNEGSSTIGNSTQVLKPDIQDTIYKRFFLAGMFIILTFGASWGAWLLWRIGFDASFTGISVNEINAHGQAQFFGWIGFFMMGFAYQAFPRFWHTELAKPPLAVTTFAIMLTGIITACVGTALAGHWHGALLLATIGSICEFVAVSIFAWQIHSTWRQSGMRLEPYIAYIFVALLWLVISAAFNTWHTWNTVSTAENREQLLHWVATYQAPLRDMQFHGLAMTMIFGVSLYTLPHLFGLPTINRKRAYSVLSLLTLGVVAEVLLFISYRLSHNHLLAAMLLLPWLAITTASFMIVFPWRLWKPFPEPDRSAKFIQAGFAWLFVSLLLLLFLPLYQAVSHLSFSHAYYGAVRHAITVGFISLMIMGYAAKVVPTLNGINLNHLSRLWGPFLLVNIGCFMRVTTQIATDWSPSIFPFIGVSGTLEVAGIAWWTIHLVRLMLHDRRKVSFELPADRPSKISAGDTVASVLIWYPVTEPIFLQHGFDQVTNPIMRTTVARQLTIAQTCRMRGVDTEMFVRDLNNVVVPCD